MRIVWETCIQAREVTKSEYVDNLDQSLYPANSGPELGKRINKALRRADQVRFQRLSCIFIF